ncbi:MAG: cysteine desulfurase NifS [Sedimentisphaerales bacterium]|nr:cysteine desulfurase NifS [Sedimentisphaerales bacterium]
MKTVYLDNNATTAVDPEVLQEMMPYLTELYGNASSIHNFGGQLGKKIDHARQQAAQLLNCHPTEIIFTCGGTESDNTAIFGTLARYPDKKHIVTTRVEHPAVRATCRQLQQQGYKLTELPVDAQGRIDLDQLQDEITDNTALVSIMYANNETGNIFPLKRIADIVKDKGAILHTDAVQAVGKIPIDLAQLPVDLLSVSGHKLHAPKGIGLLYIRRGTRIAPFMVGGHQEFSKRAGTENVPAIVALGQACQLAQKHMTDENTRVKQLRDQLEAGLIKTCPNSRINGDPHARVPNTTNISFEYIEGEAILLQLDRLGIAASSGSACTSGSLEPSHVLRAMGVPFTAVHGSIRFSLSRFNTQEEIAYVLEKVPPVIKLLRSMSPFSPENSPNEILTS